MPPKVGSTLKKHDMKREGVYRGVLGGKKGERKATRPERDIH